MHLFLKIGLQLLAVSIAIIVSFLDYVAHDKRTRRFRLIRRAPFILSLLLLASSVGLTVWDDRADEAARRELQLQLESASQPVQEVSLGFSVRVPMTHPRLRSYWARLSRGINSTLSTKEARFGLYISSRSATGEMLNLGVSESSPLFPNAAREPLAYFLLNFVGIRADFYAPENKEFSESSKADLSLPLTAIIDRSVPILRRQGNDFAITSLSYDTRSKQVLVTANDWQVPSGNWQSNGRLQSLPAIMRSVLVVRFYGYMRTNHPEVREYLDEIQRTINVSHVNLKVSGRRFEFGTRELKPRQAGDGSTMFVAPVASSRDQLAH